MKTMRLNITETNLYDRTIKTTVSQLIFTISLTIVMILQKVIVNKPPPKNMLKISSGVMSASKP
jgi:hypothetical protein